MTTDKKPYSCSKACAAVIRFRGSYLHTKLFQKKNKITDCLIATSANLILSFWNISISLSPHLLQTKFKRHHLLKHLRKEVVCRTFWRKVNYTI